MRKASFWEKPTQSTWFSCTACLKRDFSWFSGVPRLTEDASAEELSAVRKVADLFQLPYLVTICDNIEREEEFLNPSIGTFLNDETSARMKDLFFNKSTHADVVFLLQG